MTTPAQPHQGDGQASPFPIGPADYVPEINEKNVAEIMQRLALMDDLSLTSWITALTWEHTETSGHWDRIEAGNRELDSRLTLGSERN